MSYKRFLTVCAILVGCAATTGASANPHWPGKIVGTWKGVGNQSPIVLTVSTQTTGTGCANITGTILDVNGGYTGDMIGFYCPASGTVEFFRFPTGGNVPFQVYSGNVSQASPPEGVHGILMGGSFSQYNQAYGPLGQYSFSLTN